ncbi:energy transducer TonB [Campylobacter hyointestinalis]|uniref:energy transducer TonB n=1 Tax=Campylobacter hyointestinalis TaxID=198 RepID=UPI000DCD026F|nr:energy transducer TonB [Campylobacter hyointestinalis]RAZ51226.1 energy transducer TonB [Campylobacter hyointestinalis subsp. lawsonii]
MRYFLLSFVLNLAILFLPLHSDEAQKPSKNITIKLNETKEQEYPKIEPKPKKEEIKQDLVEELTKIEKAKDEPIKKEAQKSKPQPKPKKVLKDIHKVEKIEQISEISIQNQFDKSQISNKTTQNIVNEFKKSEDVCLEGVGFIITNKIEPTYPKKALLLRLRDTFRVEVEFQINKDGSIKILKVNGKSEIFNDQAKILTQKLDIKVLKDGISNCKIIKPYEFKFKG